MTGLTRGKDINALYKQKDLHQRDQVSEFQFETEKSFSDPASKQLFEGVSINQTPSTPGFLMNSKCEYKQREVARVLVVRGLGY